MDDLKVKFEAGGSFVHISPKFGQTSENIYVGSNNYISSYNTKTGKLCTTYKGLSSHIIAFDVHEYQSQECLTGCSETGEVITWKTVTHFKIFNKKIRNRTIETFNIVTRNGDNLKALFSYKTGQIRNFAIFDLITEAITPLCDLDLEPGPCISAVAAENFGAVAQRQSIHMFRFRDFSQISTLRLESSRSVTCLACHHDEEVLLVGDNTGRVIVYQNLFASRSSQAIYHWHTLPVKCLAFSPHGSYFYSGGEECVLVRWQAGNHLEKKFLPRLPSLLKHVQVSPSNLYILIATEDNGITTVDVKFDRISLVQNLVIGHQFRSGILCCPRTKTLVMNGNVGQIQFYSPQDNSLLYNVDVVGPNKISNERNCRIENTTVTKIALNFTGLWMGTVEERPDLEYSPELRLKFWHFDSTTQNFSLNTNIEYPHQDSINAVAFQPLTGNNYLRCVSVGEDKKFKVWHLTDASTIYSKGDAWKLLYVGFYRDLPCKNVAFTADSSLMAIGFDDIITMWLPEIGDLKSSLLHPVYKQKIQHLKFGKGVQCHLVTAAGDQHIIVWNILTLTAVWIVPLKVAFLIDSSVTMHMAVITEDAKVFVFMPNAPDVIYSSDSILADHKRIEAAVFVPTKYSNDSRLKWYQRTQLYFIDSNQELHCIGVDEENECPLIPIDNGFSSAFSMTVAKSKVNLADADARLNAPWKLNKMQSPYISKFLDCTTYTMAPVRDTCHSILKEMVTHLSKEF